LAKTRSLSHATLVAALLASVALLTLTSRAERAFANTVARCQETQLDVKITSDGVATGHVGDLILLTNVGASACTVTGYPTVSMSGVNVVTTVAKKTKNGFLGGLGGTGTTLTIPVVTLRAHGGAASSIVEGGDVPVGNAVGCVTFTKVSVALAHLSPSYRFTTKFPGCIRPEVHPFVRGSKGLPYK
jgi:hypothetical protein